MKIKSTNQNEVKSIIDPQDKPGAAKSAGTKLQTSTGVGSVISQFEIQSPTVLDKMLERKNLQPDPGDRDIRVESKYYGWSIRLLGSDGKVREKLARQEANQKLSADQFSVNEKSQGVVKQNQAETLNAQSENVKAPRESHLEARSVVEPEDIPLRNSGPIIGTNIEAIKIKK